MEKGPKFSNLGGSDEAMFLSRGEARQADKYGATTREEYLNILASKDYDKLSNFERATLEKETAPADLPQDVEPVGNTKAVEDVAKTIQEVSKSQEATPEVQEFSEEDFKAAVELNSKVDEDLKEIDEKFERGDVAEVEPTAAESKEKKSWFNRLKKSKFGKAAISAIALVGFAGGMYALNQNNESEPEQDRTEQVGAGSTFSGDTQAKPTDLDGKELSKEARFVIDNEGRFTSESEKEYSFDNHEKGNPIYAKTAENFNGEKENFNS